jgi:hypothetical protein
MFWGSSHFMVVVRMLPGVTGILKYKTEATKLEVLIYRLVDKIAT